MSDAPDGPGRTTPTVVVVGAGITGLAAAWRLRRSNRRLRVVVLEQAPRHGGALLSRPLAPDVLSSAGPVVVDVGAEALLARRPEAVALIHEVGLGDDLLHPATSRAAIYSRRALHPIPAGTVMGVPGDPGSLRGLLTDDEIARVSAEPALPAPPVQGDVDVASWVAGRVGQAVVDRLVEPLLGGVYAGRASALSLHATLPVLWPAALHGASVLDTVRRHAASAAAAAGADEGAAQPAPVFAGIRGGVTRLVDTLVERLLADGVEVRTQACVQALERKGSGWALALGPAGRGEVLAADAVVLALPAARASRLLAQAAPEASAELAGITSASMAVGTYVVPASVLDGLDLSGFLVPPVEDRLVKAVTFSSRKWAWLADLTPGKAVLRASFGRAGEEATLQRPDRDLLAAGAADVAQMLLRAVPVHAAQLTRWGGALPQYEVGHVERVARIRALVGAQTHLAVAGASYDGVGVPACIASADAAVASVLAQLG